MRKIQRMDMIDETAKESEKERGSREKDRERKESEARNKLRVYWPAPIGFS